MISSCSSSSTLPRNSSSSDFTLPMRPTEAQLRFAQFCFTRAATNVKSKIECLWHQPSSPGQVAGVTEEDMLDSSREEKEEEEQGAPFPSPRHNRPPRVSKGRRALLRVSQRKLEKRRQQITRLGFHHTCSKDVVEEIQQETALFCTNPSTGVTKSNRNPYAFSKCKKSSALANFNMTRKRRISSPSRNPERARRFEAAFKAALNSESTLSSSASTVSTATTGSDLPKNTKRWRRSNARPSGTGSNINPPDWVKEKNRKKEPVHNPVLPTKAPLDRGASWLVHLPKRHQQQDRPTTGTPKRHRSKPIDAVSTAPSFHRNRNSPKGLRKQKSLPRLDVDTTELATAPSVPTKNQSVRTPTRHQYTPRPIFAEAKRAQKVSITGESRANCFMGSSSSLILDDASSNNNSFIDYFAVETAVKDDAAAKSDDESCYNGRILRKVTCDEDDETKGFVGVSGSESFETPQHIDRKVDLLHAALEVSPGGKGSSKTQEYCPWSSKDQDCQEENAKENGLSEKQHELLSSTSQESMVETDQDIMSPDVEPLFEGLRLEADRNLGHHEEVFYPYLQSHLDTTQQLQSEKSDILLDPRQQEQDESKVKNEVAASSPDSNVSFDTARYQQMKRGIKDMRSSCVSMGDLRKLILPDLHDIPSSDYEFSEQRSHSSASDESFLPIAVKGVSAPLMNEVILSMAAWSIQDKGLGAPHFGIEMEAAIAVDAKDGTLSNAKNSFGNLSGTQDNESIDDPGENCFHRDGQRGAIVPFTWASTSTEKVHSCVSADCNQDWEGKKIPSCVSADCNQDLEGKKMHAKGDPEDLEMDSGRAYGCESAPKDRRLDLKKTQRGLSSASTIDSIMKKMDSFGRKHIRKQTAPPKGGSMRTAGCGLSSEQANPLQAQLMKSHSDGGDAIDFDIKWEKRFMM